MADIRIKDLTTLESASLTGDVFVIDGTTGTRKLSAFSPTFGGNATVTGTLTVNGAATLSATGTNTIAGVLQFSNATPYLFPNAADKTLTIYGSSNANVGLTLYGDTHATKASQAEFIGSTLVRVLATTASTTTSTGALVVGNGTSGGLGVGGAIHSGSNIRATGNLYAGDSSVSTGAVSIQVGDTRTGSGFAHLDLVGDTTYSDYGLRIIRGNGGANTTSTVTHRGTGALQITTEESASIVLSTASTTALTLTSAQQVQVNATTASTSTSSGALVVSGGVGVAGAIYAGGSLNISGTGGNTIAGNTTFSTGQIIVSNAFAPASASAAGTTGSITWDNAYIYVCVATNTWKRVAISTW